MYMEFQFPNLRLEQTVTKITMSSARTASRTSRTQKKVKENSKSLKRKRDQEDIQKLESTVEEFVSTLALESELSEI